MLPTATTVLLLLLLTTTQSHPLYITGPGPDAPPTSTTTPTTTITAPQLLLIAPQSSTCAGAPFPAECRTASQAARALSASFRTYDISSAGEQAALISLIAFETDDFRYNKNHSPGRPGQGTRNMQMPDWNLLYAASLPAVASALASLPAAADVDAVRALLLASDEVDFGSAAWFLTTRCGPDVRSGLRSGGRRGWEAYLAGCVHAEVTAERVAYWERAGRALGVGGA